MVVALGVTADGRKQVLGLWHGATENSTVAKGLLEDLMERGLDPSNPLLFIIDGSKALRKAIREVFGSHAPVQRCRVHKQRNIIEYLPKQKRQQAIWRLRVAWDKSDPEEAKAQLRKTVRWLDAISPSAARSLEEGLEETLTLHAETRDQRYAPQKLLFNEPDRKLLFAQRRVVPSGEALEKR